MTETGPLHEARALLRQFSQSKLRVCEVETAHLSLFASRDPAMRRAPAAIEPGHAAFPPDTTDLVAPHLGTLHAPVPVGTAVRAGATVAMLIVLDRHRPVLAEIDGIVSMHLRAPGDLVQFGEPILALSGGTNP